MSLGVNYLLIESLMHRKVAREILLAPTKIT